MQAHFSSLGETLHAAREIHGQTPEPKDEPNVTTYTLPAYVISADASGIPNLAFTSTMEFITPPNSQPGFSYSVLRVEDFDGLGDTNVVSLNQTILRKTVDNSAIVVPETNYHAIFEVQWGAGNRSIVMLASADTTTRVGIVLDGDPFPSINSLGDYYAWVDTFTSLTPVTSGPLAPGQQISYTTFPNVSQLASALITGTPGDDFLESGPGDDVIDGRGGIDTLRLDGDITQYTLSLSPEASILTDRVIGRDGSDILISIEQLEFSSGSPSVFDIGIRSGATGLSAEDFAAITELYVAYFDRAPAAQGLLYWATRLDDGMSLPEIAESFFVQPETQRTYASFLNEDGSLVDTQSFVTAVFNNVLGRAPTSSYWVNELDNNPDITPAIFILAVLNGAKAVTGGAADRDYLEAKTDIGVYFSAIKGLSDRDDTVTVMNIFDGSAASVTAAVAAIDQIHTDALDPNTGEFLMPLVGVIDDPFAGA
jgi:hypothetical protein